MLINENIILVSLANTGIFKDYVITSREDLDNAYTDFNNILESIGLADTDIERQVADGVCNDRTVDQLEDMIRLSEEHRLELDIIHELLEYYNNIDDIERILDNGAYYIYDEPEDDAFISYCEDLDILGNCPEFYKAYFDYDKLKRDMSYSGMTILGDYNRTIFINY